jgi:hypothetical protein
MGVGRFCDGDERGAGEVDMDSVNDGQSFGRRLRHAHDDQRRHGSFEKRPA